MLDYEQDDAEGNPGLQRWSEVDDQRYAFPWAPAFCLAGFLLLLVVGELARSLVRCSLSWTIDSLGLVDTICSDASRDLSAVVLPTDAGDRSACGRCLGTAEQRSTVSEERPATSQL